MHYREHSSCPIISCQSKVSSSQTLTSVYDNIKCVKHLINAFCLNVSCTFEEEGTVSLYSSSRENSHLICYMSERLPESNAKTVHY